MFFLIGPGRVLDLGTDPGLSIVQTKLDIFTASSKTEKGIFWRRSIKGDLIAHGLIDIALVCMNDGKVRCWDNIYVIPMPGVWCTGW